MLVNKQWSPEYVGEKLKLDEESTKILNCAYSCHPDDEIWIFFNTKEILKETQFTKQEKKYCVTAFQEKRYPGPLIWHRPAGFDAYNTYSPVHTCCYCSGSGTTH